MNRRNNLCNAQNVNQPISVKTARRKENRITFVSTVVVNSSISMNPTLGYSESIKRDCLKMYVNGMGLRAIERVKGVHHTTVINWVKQVGKLLPDVYDPEVLPEVGEIDELQTYVKKNRQDRVVDSG